MKLSRLQKIRQGAQALLDESPLQGEARFSRLHKFAHFWILVWRSFSRNRCPVRASALAYATLLALIPMLAVVVSVSSTFLKKEGEDRIDHFIATLVASVTPPDVVSTNTVPSMTRERQGAQATNAAPAQGVKSTDSAGTNAATATAEETSPPSGAASAAAPSNAGSDTPNPAAQPGAGAERGSSRQAAINSLAQDERVIAARRDIARSIHKFIQNTRSGTLGVTGSVLLIFVGISMLSRIETTFNDIWGVARGRTWFMRIVLYWGVISLAPLLLIVAAGLASGPHLQGTKDLLISMPFIGNLIFRILPLVLVCLTFGLFYMLMPNAKVHWRAALVGGVVGGLLFHLNNAVSVLYVSRVVSNSKIYGSLGLVPVFMIGLYFSWLILLFGAQVAYAYQNRTTYLEEKQVENINQRGREFIALRLMTYVGQRFERGEPPPTILEMAERLGVPTRLIRHLMQTLGAARLVIEAAGPEVAYVPARPLETISCHDILLALRASHGQELPTGEEPARAEVYGEFERIMEAERQVASSVSMLALVQRTRDLQGNQAPKTLE